MAIAESIKQKIENTLTPLLAPSQDYMIIGGIASNLLSTDAYLTIESVVYNEEIKRGSCFQFQIKDLLLQESTLVAIASDTPITNWESGDSDIWNSSSLDIWDSSQPGYASVLLKLTVAAI